MTNFEHIKNMDIETLAILFAKTKARAVEEALHKVGVVGFKVSERSLARTTLEIYEFLTQERDNNA